MPPTSTPPPNAASAKAAAAAPSPAGKSAVDPWTWKRNPVFRLFSSVKLAVVLLAVVIVASAAGTIYESSFDAKVARAYVYNARWFNLWLLVLGLNLLCSALSRLPWKRRHTGFLITHLGIIILLIGAVVGRTFGIEGTMTIFKGQPANNQLIIDEHVLRLEENGTPMKPFVISVIGRQPSEEKPWLLGYTPGGWKVEMTAYTEKLKTDFEPQAVPAAAASRGIGGQPAVRVHLASKRLKQNIDSWLLAGDQEHGSLDLGLASVQLRRGTAPAPKPVPAVAAPMPAPAPAPVAAVPAPAAPGDQQPPAPAADGSTTAPAPPASAAAATPVSSDATSGTPPPAPLATDPNAVDEIIVAFALKPGEQVSQPIAGKPSGVKVRFADPAKREVTVEWRGATWVFNLDTDMNKPQDLSGSGISVTIEGYWNDFTTVNGQPANASTDPKNPAVALHVRGKLPPLADNDPFADPAGGHVDTNTAAATTNPSSPGAENQAILYCDDKGALTFSLKTSASPEVIYGKMTPGEAINTGWADWQVQADQVMPQAVPQTTFRALNTNAHGSGDGAAGAANAAGDGPMMGGGGGANMTEGVRVRLSRNGETHEEWVASGWRVTLPTSNATTLLTYGFRIYEMPVGVELTNFEVERQEGNDAPASFKSSLRVSDAEGNSGTGSCSMNQPFNFPGHWWNTFTGLTYKVSQASWNPDNLSQSSVQILRDPGWTFKWVGSLLICSGIFTLFYLRPAPRGGRVEQK